MMFKTASNYYKKIFVGTYANVTSAQLEKLGFTINGRLPNNDSEIAIPLHVAENMILGSTDNPNFSTALTEDTILNKYIVINDWSRTISNKKFKIVGIVDDKTKFEKYEKKSDEELKTMSEIETVICKSWASVAYVDKTIVDGIIDDYQECAYGYDLNSDSPRELSVYTSNIATTVSICDKIEASLINYGSSEGFTYNYYQKNEGTYLIKVTESASVSYILYTNDYYYKISITSDADSKYSYNYVYKYAYNSSASQTLYSSELTTFSETYPLDADTGFPKNFVTNASTRANALNYVFLKNNNTYIRADHLNSDGTLKALGDDEVILNLNCLNGERSDIISKIDAGTYTYKIYKSRYYADYDNSQQPLLNLKVVGVFGDGYSMRNIDMVLSSESEKSIADCFGSYTLILTSLNGSNSDDELIKECETFSESGIKFTVQNDATTMLDMFENIITQTAQVLFYVAIVFAVFAAFLLMNFISTSIAHKRREIGVLRALGARGSDVFGIFFNESLIIVFINFVLSAIATFVGCMLINQAIISGLGVSIALASVGLRQILLLLGVSVGSAFLASFIPTMKISRKKPIDAINNR